MKTYNIDEAMMGSEWRGDMESFRSVLQDVLDDDYNVTVSGMFNGACNVDPETGDEVTITEDQWLLALDRHAAIHPEMWACS